MRTLPTLVAAFVLLAAALVAQQPGDYPHLTLTDGLGAQVPPPGGPFDNSAVFSTVQAIPIDVDVSYAPFSGPATNVAWALILSGMQTPLPTNIVPPPLFAAPPFVFILPPIPTLSGDGTGSLTLSTPLGVFFAETYLQALVYDATNTPRLQASNGITIEVSPPGFSVSVGWMRNLTGTELTAEVGEIDIGPQTLNTLKPIGTTPPPLAVPIPLGGDPAGGAQTGIFRYDSIALNESRDGPVNPLDFVITTLASPLPPEQDAALVASVRGFPPSGVVYIGHGAATIGVNPFGPRAAVQPFLAPRIEVARYDGIDYATSPPRLLNLKRDQVGTTGPDPLNHTIVGSYVVSPVTHVSTLGARRRQGAAQDHVNIDTPHVALPPFSFFSKPLGQQVTMEIDLFRYSDAISLVTTDVEYKRTGFMVFDHVTQRFRLIQGTTRTPSQGTWDPLVHAAPDGRSFIACLRANPTAGVFGWDNRADEIWAIRTDGETWPATGTETWRITWVLGPSPAEADTNVPARYVHMPFLRILGPDPDNYVLYAGIGYKFKKSATGNNCVGLVGPSGPTCSDGLGFEGRWLREEVIVNEVLEVPLTPPGSAKPVPTLPAAFVSTAFGNSGFGNPIVRFDPHVLVADDDSMMLLSAGSNFGTPVAIQEDAFVIRNVSVNAAGQPVRLIANISGHKDAAGSAGDFAPVNNRPFFTPSYPGHGAKAALSPGKTRAAWVAQATGELADWLQVARTNGLDFGKVVNVYQNASGVFQQSGALTTNRVITDLHFLDEDNLVFFMGRAPYDTTSIESLDLYRYEIPTGVITNLTKTGSNAPVGTDFELGNIRPRGSFTSPNGLYRYFLRGGSAGAGEQLSNIVAINRQTRAVFSITGQEFGFTSVLPSLVRGATEGPGTLSMILGSPPAQDGMVYFAAHESGTTGDEVFAFDADFPFVALQVTSVEAPGVHVSNITPNPFSGHVAFARTAGTNPLDDDQHPFVVDLDAFLFERDLVPGVQIGGQPVGRVMDGSFRFVPPSGNAGEALVFTFGGTALAEGIANFAPPAYYPLANVSNELNEPVPVVIALTDTALLGLNFRFYVMGATVSGSAP